MKKITKKVLAFLLVIAIELNIVNMPVTYAQENVGHNNEYIEINETETEAYAEDNASIESETQVGETVSTESEMQTEETVSTESETQAESINITESETQTKNTALVENEMNQSEDETESADWDNVTTEEIFEGKDFKVTFTITSYWDTGYNANIRLENTGDSIIQNWCLGFDYDNVITNIWNAGVIENNGKKYVIKNADWNQDIAVGGNIEFGISGDHAFRGFPKNYELIGASTEVQTEDYAIKYIVESDWGTGFTSSISIANNTNAALEDWVLEFDFDREITEIWNGVIEKHEGNHYVVRNATYNSTIIPMGSVSFGMKGSNGETEDKPSDYVLYSYKDVNKNENS